MLNYSEPLYRPPAEANSLIIQVTLGCSFNNCAFCTMYETKQYQIRSLEDIYMDMTKASNYKNITRVFLADGDALGLKTEYLLKILQYLKRYLPKLRRVSIYASAFNLYEKSQHELELLKQNGLTLIYYGIESGNYEVLKKVNKPITQEKMITGLNKAHNAGIKISATVILGLAGKKLSKQHIKDSAFIINKTNITYLSTLQLMLTPQTYEKFLRNFDMDFQELNDKEMLEEQKEFLKELNPANKVIFRSNHASNSFALAGNLPKDKEKLIYLVEMALNNDNLITPSFLRGF